MLVAIKVCVCVYVGREVFLFCKFLLKKKIELQSLARFLIYIKRGVEEMKCFLTHQHLTHKNLISNQKTPGYFAIGVFLPGYCK